ncbi:MAG: hypothetical protein H7222_17465 [Methylotenera sp.]|nr:hypothetical protein [Oligoflexia bacterium]
MKNSNKWVVLVLSALSMNLESAFAQSSEQVVIDGRDSVLQLRLDSEESHTLYSQRIVPDTCYRTEQRGYRDVFVTQIRHECAVEHLCRVHNENVCRTGTNGVQSCILTPLNKCGDENVCRDVSVLLNHPEPVYVQVAYACTKVETYASGTELDYLVTADVNLNIAALPVGSRAREVLQASLSGTNLSLASVSSEGSLLFLAIGQVSNQVTQTKRENGAGQKVVTANYDIQAVSAKDLKSPLTSITGSRIEDGVLKFSIGKVVHPEMLNIALHVDKHRNLIGRKDLFTGVLSSAQVVLNDVGNQTEVSIDLSQLDRGSEMNKGKLKFEITVSSDAGQLGTLLNPKVMGAKSINGTYEVKL